jgi:thiazole/oxazole-forming peptide maturase SagD family component
MRKNESGVAILGRIHSVTIKRFIIRSSGGTHINSFLEIVIAFLLKIKEGTLFIVEHKNDYGIRSTIDTLVNSGFIKKYGEGYLFCDYPRINYAGIVFSLNSDIDEVQRAWGYTLPDESTEISFLKALFEALERHATYYNPSLRSVIYPKFIKGDASFLYELIPHFSDKQLKKFPFLVGSAQQLKNVLGFKVQSLLTGDTCFLPVSVFYYGKALISSEIPALFDPTSSGSGAGQTLEDATLSALYEMIERDHFLLYWFSGITPNEILYENDESRFGSYVTAMRKRYNLEVRFFDIGYDYSVTAIFCVVIDPVLNIIACGAKVGQNTESVMEGALLEAIAVISSLRGRGEMIGSGTMRKILDENWLLNHDLDRKKRVNMYCSLEGISLIRTKWLDKKHAYVNYEDLVKKNKAFNSKKEELNFMKQNCKDLFKKYGRGYDVFFHEHSSLYIKKIGCHVVHVFAPALLKLHLTEPMATPLSERLTLFTKQKGIEYSFDEEGVSSFIPHFFP